MPPGSEYFNDGYIEVDKPADRDKVLVVHNNWIIGHDPKRKRFQDNGLWEVGDWEFPTCERRRRRM